jgi:hypothetical protein
VALVGVSWWLVGNGGSGGCCVLVLRLVALVLVPPPPPPPSSWWGGACGCGCGWWLEWLGWLVGPTTSRAGPQPAALGPRCACAACACTVPAVGGRRCGRGGGAQCSVAVWRWRWRARGAAAERSAQFAVRSSWSAVGGVSMTAITWLGHIACVSCCLFGLPPRPLAPLRRAPHAPCGMHHAPSYYLLFSSDDILPYCMY